MIRVSMSVVAGLVGLTLTTGPALADHKGAGHGKGTSGHSSGSASHGHRTTSHPGGKGPGTSHRTTSHANARSKHGQHDAGRQVNRKANGGERHDGHKVRQGERQASRKLHEGEHHVSHKTHEGERHVARKTREGERRVSRKDRDGDRRVARLDERERRVGRRIAGDRTRVVDRGRVVRRPLSRVDRTTIINIANTIVSNAGVKNALLVLGRGGVLAPGQVTALTDFIDDPACELSATERGVIRRGIAASGEEVIEEEDGERSTATTATEEEETAAAPTLQTRRYLRVKNDTKEALTVNVQYRTPNDDGDLTWFPAHPKLSDKAVRFELKPGEEVYVEDQGERVDACVVRIWAESESGDQYDDYKGKDLKLVTETTAKGESGYLAEEMETYEFAFQS